MRFADALCSLGEKQPRLRLGRIQTPVDRLYEASNFTGYKSGLEEVARARFQRLAFRVQHALEVDHPLKFSAQDFVFRIEQLLQHGQSILQTSSRVKISVC